MSKEPNEIFGEKAKAIVDESADMYIELYAKFCYALHSAIDEIPNGSSTSALLLAASAASSRICVNALLAMQNEPPLDSKTQTELACQVVERVTEIVKATRS